MFDTDFLTFWVHSHWVISFVQPLALCLLPVLHPMRPELRPPLSILQRLHWHLRALSNFRRKLFFFLSWTAASSRAEMQPPLLIPTWSIFNSLTFITTHYFDNKTKHCSAGICILQHTNKRVQGRNEWILPGGWFVLETTQFLGTVEYFLCFQ